MQTRASLLQNASRIHCEYITPLDNFITTVTHRPLTLTHKMKSFVAIFALVAVAAADVSHIVHNADAAAQIVQQDADVLPDQYQYKYQTSNGIAGQESGVLKPSSLGGEPAIAVDGSNSYTSPEGIPISIIYTADEYGYNAQGAHLPTPPPPQPIPDYILRAIEYIRTHPSKPEPNQKY